MVTLSGTLVFRLILEIIVTLFILLLSVAIICKLCAKKDFFYTFKKVTSKRIAMTVVTMSCLFFILQIIFLPKSGNRELLRTIDILKNAYFITVDCINEENKVDTSYAFKEKQTIKELAEIISKSKYKLRYSGIIPRTDGPAMLINAGIRDKTRFFLCSIIKDGIRVYRRSIHTCQEFESSDKEMFDKILTLAIKNDISGEDIPRTNDNP